MKARKHRVRDMTTQVSHILESPQKHQQADAEPHHQIATRRRDQTKIEDEAQLTDREGVYIPMARRTLKPSTFSFSFSFSFYLSLLLRLNATLPAVRFFFSQHRVQTTLTPECY